MMAERPLLHNKPDDGDESQVPYLAVKALNAAQRRATQALRTQVLVKNGKLIKLENGTISELMPLQLRKRVSVKKKSRKP